MRISTWTKPGTTESRVYFNAVASVKVFAVESSGMFEVKFSRGLYQSQQDLVMDEIDRELEKMNGGERVVSWLDLLKIAN